MSLLDTFVFDTTPLTHFARAALDSELKQICEGVNCCVLKDVEKELRRGLDRFPENKRVLDVDWLTIQELSLADLALFSEYARRIGATGDHDTGECATLAWAESRQAIAIVDDQEARNAGEARGVRVHGTAWLIVQGFTNGLFTEDTANSLADRLLETGIRFPFQNGEFISWARRERVLE